MAVVVVVVGAGKTLEIISVQLQYMAVPRSSSRDYRKGITVKSDTYPLPSPTILLVDLKGL